MRHLNIHIIINPLLAKLSHLNFYPLEIVFRYRDPQLQVSKNYSYVFNLRPHNCESWCLFRKSFNMFNSQKLHVVWSENKTDYKGL